MKNILYDTDNYLIFSFNDVDTDVSATSSDSFFSSPRSSLSNSLEWFDWNQCLSKMVHSVFKYLPLMTFEMDENKIYTGTHQIILQLEVTQHIHKCIVKWEGD